MYLFLFQNARLMLEYLKQYNLLTYTKKIYFEFESFEEEVWKN